MSPALLLSNAPLQPVLGPGRAQPHSLCRAPLSWYPRGPLRPSDCPLLSSHLLPEVSLAAAVHTSCTVCFVPPLQPRPRQHAWRSRTSGRWGGGVTSDRVELRKPRGLHPAANTHLDPVRNKTKQEAQSPPGWKEGDNLHPGKPDGDQGSVPALGGLPHQPCPQTACQSSTVIFPAHGPREVPSPSQGPPGPTPVSSQSQWDQNLQRHVG